MLVVFGLLCGLCSAGLFWVAFNIQPAAFNGAFPLAFFAVLALGMAAWEWLWD